MRTLLVLALLSVTALAEDLPSRLPDGKYGMRCQLLTVNRGDSADKFNVTDAVNRNVVFSSGTLEVSTNAGVVTEKRDSINYAGDGSIHNVTILERRFRSLGKDLFEETADGSVSMQAVSGPDKGDSKSKKFKYWRAITVKSGFEILTVAKSNDDAVSASQGEKLTTKDGDGVYTILDYNRGEFHVEGGEGRGEGRTVLFASSRCAYTPLK